MAAPEPTLAHDDVAAALSDAYRLLTEIARRNRPADPSPADPAPSPTDDAEAADEAA